MMQAVYAGKSNTRVGRFMETYLELAWHKFNIPVNDQTKIVPCKKPKILLPYLRNEYTDRVPHNPVIYWYPGSGWYGVIVRFIGRLLHNEAITHKGQYYLTICNCAHCQPFGSFVIDTNDYKDVDNNPCMGYDLEHNILAVYVPDGKRE